MKVDLMFKQWHIYIDIKMICNTITVFTHTLCVCFNIVSRVYRIVVVLFLFDTRLLIICSFLKRIQYQTTITWIYITFVDTMNQF